MNYTKKFAYTVFILCTVTFLTGCANNNASVKTENTSELYNENISPKTPTYLPEGYVLSQENIKKSSVQTPYNPYYYQSIYQLKRNESTIGSITLRQTPVLNAYKLDEYIAQYKNSEIYSEKNAPKIREITLPETKNNKGVITHFSLGQPRLFFITSDNIFVEIKPESRGEENTIDEEELIQIATNMQ